MKETMAVAITVWQLPWFVCVDEDSFVIMQQLMDRHAITIMLPSSLLLIATPGSEHIITTS